MRFSFLFAFAGGLWCSGLSAAKPNVLLILVDDLKPALGCYGDSAAITPNIDALAKSGLRFDCAYSNQAVCAPSRFNLMLGTRSTTSGIYSFGKSFRKPYPKAVTLPQYFHRHGYTTESLGKVYHFGHGNTGDSQSWSIPHFKDKVIEYILPVSKAEELTREEAMFQNAYGKRPIHSFPRGAAWEAPEVKDEAYADGRVAAETIRRLQKAAKNPNQPFFIACGFARPHLPFSAPKKYWDLHDPAKLPMPSYEKYPIGAPEYALKKGGEIKNYKPVPESGLFKDWDLTRKLIHGYYASTTYMDAQVGKVVRELSKLGLDPNTIVVLWGDHGFHLGDHGFWTKHTNYEQASRIPIIIRAPGITAAGSSTRQPIETVDLFPTLAALAGLPDPKVPQPLDGESHLPVAKDPNARVSDHVYLCYKKGKRIGRAIRTERYRLVEWKVPGAAPETAVVELYDYQSDPLEKENLAKQQPEALKALRAILAKYPEARVN
ncbi:MAG: sulfatase [Akkermansiaceae bacterium]